MKKLLAALSCAAMVAIPTAAAASQSDIPVGGTFGLPDCWVRVYVGEVVVSTQAPFVHIRPSGDPGPEVHCPLWH